MNTRYPIVLVHGLAMKDTFFMKSWGRIDRLLRIQGYTVYKSDVDGFGTVAGNAAQLKAEIEGILRETGAEKVNLIAHSKGGLDAKYMIQQLDMADRVASLTTLCTPHRGTPIASFILRFPKAAVKYVAFWVNTAYRILGDKAPDSFTACEELQRTHSLEEETVNVADGVMCQSFSAAVRPGERSADFVMAVPLLFSRFLEKDRLTDGMVPRDSAIFGVYRGDCLDGSVTHTQIVDFMVRGKKRDKIYAFYSALCEELVQAGF
ncbi:MAG: triacylglycerol lipase [Clostridia bacterium]|nr:triacylglycerol lipase [Clostridia bacterium]